MPNRRTLFAAAAAAVMRKLNRTGRLHTHRGPTAADWGQGFERCRARFGGPGNLRADYVLPDRFTRIVSSFVFWPATSDPLFPLVGTFNPALLPNGNGFPSSDHRLVAVDIKL